jgi:hypothetical protein
VFIFLFKAYLHKDIPTIYMTLFYRVPHCEPTGWPLTGSSRPSQKIRHHRKVPTSRQRLATIFPHFPTFSHPPPRERLFFTLLRFIFRTARLKSAFCDFVKRFAARGRRDRPREMEHISRGSSFGDFVTILTERSMQDVTVERFRVIFTTIAITRKLYIVTVYIEYYTLYILSTTVIHANKNKTKRESALYSSN